MEETAQETIEAVSVLKQKRVEHEGVVKVGEKNLIISFEEDNSGNYRVSAGFEGEDLLLYTYGEDYEEKIDSLINNYSEKYIALYKVREALNEKVSDNKHKKLLKELESKIKENPVETVEEPPQNQELEVDKDKKKEVSP